MKHYYTMQNIGKARHVVNYHDGDKTHQDGSPFYDVRIFSTKRDRERFQKELKAQGYAWKHPIDCGVRYTLKT